MESKKLDLFDSMSSRVSIPFNLKVIYTSLFAILYLIFLNIPIFGVPSSGGTDPFFAFRVIMASQRGSLAEFGIFPLVYASFIMHVLVGLGIYKMDFTQAEKRKKFSIIVTILGLFFSLTSSLCYVIFGAYGEISVDQGFIIIPQLLLASTLIIIIDYFMRKGYGLSSGVSLFIVVSVSRTIFDGMFSLSQLRVGGFDWYRGCILAFIQGIFKEDPDILTPLIRPGLTPDFLGFILAIIVFGMTIFFVSFTIKRPFYQRDQITKSSMTAQSLYNYSNSVVITSSFFANISFVSNMMFNTWSSFSTGFRSLLVSFFGRWETIEGTNQLAPVSGLAAFTTPPYGVEQITQHPWNTSVYFLFMIVYSILMSRLLVKTSGKENVSILKGTDIFNQEKYEVTNFPLALLAGFFMGFLAGFFNIISPLGTGVGILITTCILKQLLDIISHEKSKWNESRKNTEINK